MIERLFLHLRAGPRIGFGFVSCRLKHNIDYSKVPKLQEEELEIQFVRGSGPGGQATNKTANCVVLKHLPTGIVVKNHETRSIEQNKKRAREIMVTKLDNFINSDNSVEAQLKRVHEKKMLESNRKRERLKTMKEAWKARENLN